MTRNLADDLVADVGNVFLSLDHFGVQVSYTPVNGSARTISALITPLPSEIRQDNATRLESLSLSVFCRKHATLGISAPNEGDKVVWNTRAYSYMGVIHEDEGAWNLKFVAPQIKAHAHGKGFGF